MIMAENMEFSRKMIKNLSGDDVREGLVARGQREIDR